MKFNKKIALTVSTSLTVFMLNISSYAMEPSIVAMENFQVPSKYSHIKHNTIANKRISNFQQAESYDPELGAAPFMWANENINAKSINTSSSPKQVTASYLSSIYPEIVAEGSDAYLASLKSSKTPRSIAKLRYLSELSSGAKIAKYIQEIDGKEVFAREFNVLIDANNNPVASSGYLADKLPILSAAQQKSVNSINEQQAIEYAVANILSAPASVVTNELVDFTKTTPKNGFKNYEIINEFEQVEFANKIRVKPVWFDQRSQLLPAFYIELGGKQKQTKGQFGFGHVIAATDGAVLARNNFVNQETHTYRVFGKDPADKRLLDGPQGHEWPFIGTDVAGIRNNAFNNRTVANADYRLVTLDSGPISTGDPWLPTGATSARGNNVHAYLDIGGTDGFNVGDISAEPTSAQTFDYPFIADPTDLNDQKAAVVNLFYMNNWLHDWFYDSGFDEAAGNAQIDNFGRGGSGGDILLAEGQDSSGRNNANMSTPSDGGEPRMQMFLYDGSANQGETFDLTLTNVASAPNPLVGLPAFGPQIFSQITATVLEYTDATAPITDACQVATNPAALSNRIALLDRGECNFTVKVKNAQDAGAIAVIVANNVDGDAVITMGGDDSLITIPSMMVSQNVGIAIRQALSTGVVNATLYRNAVPDQDGTFDNAIVAHEWGHYLSNRLIGNASGLSNQQGRGMGEGWSDFLALLTFATEADKLVTGNESFQGNYPMYGWADVDAYFGIRRVPYSTDTVVNALSFKHIEDGIPLPTTHPVGFGADGSGNSAVHATGTVWATMLWEVYTALLNDPRYTFEQAQTKMKEYLVGGLKMTPVAPTLTEARDAILAVAIATDEADLNLMLEAFAKRGIGLGAESPDRRSPTHSGVKESFLSSKLAFSYTGSDLDLSTGFCSDDGILDAGETAILNVNLRNTGFDTLQNIPVQLGSTGDVTIANGGQATVPTLAPGATTAVPFTVTLNTATVDEEVTFDISFVDVDGVVEPEQPNYITNVNYTFVPDESRLSEDMENERFVNNDWSVVIDPALTADVALAESAVNIITSDTNLTKVLYIEDLPVQADISFVSPELVLGTAPFTIDFEHLYDFETGSWDGGVIEISTDAGATWQDVTTAGGTFTNGYNGTITTNVDSPINERAAFVNRSGGYLTDSVSFGTTLSNQTVRIRFRMGADAATGGYGWEIDNVTFTGITNVAFSTSGPDPQPCDGSMNSAPTAQITTPTDPVMIGQTVTLDASTSSDTDGDMLTFTWVQTAGPTVTLTNADMAIATFVVPQLTADAELGFEVTVTDGQAADISGISIFADAGNFAPTAIVASATQQVTSGDDVTLDASGSSDSDGDNITYSWVQVSGTPVVALTNATTATAGFSAPVVTQDTDLVFEVTVSDSLLESKASVTVTISPPNNPPIATVANVTINVDEGAAVSLDASPSSDPDGDALTYAWAQIAGDTVTLTNANTAIASFTAPIISSDTNMSFEVIVSDGNGNSSAATVVVNVSDINEAPSAQVARSAISVVEGRSVSMNASGSTDPNSGDTLTFSWEQTSGMTVTLNGANTATASFTAPQVTANTTLGFEVTVSDGSLEDKATVTVTVTNQAPAPTPPAPTPPSGGSGGGGGGSFGWFSVLFLSFLGLRRRRILEVTE